MNKIILLLNEIRQVLASKDSKMLARFCSDHHPALLAEILEQLSPEEVYSILHDFPLEYKAAVMGLLEPTTQLNVASMMEDSELASLINEMYSDERVDFIKLLPEVRGANVLRQVARKEREDILQLGAHQEGTAGAIMTSEYIFLKEELTVREALDRIRLEAPDTETVYYAYIIDDERLLTGFVSLRDLIMSASYVQLKDIMKRELVYAYVQDSQESVAQKLSQYDLIAIPVIDKDEKLVGIVTFDDALDVAEEEATSDFHQMGAAGIFNISMRDAGIWLLYQKRLPWLLVLVFMNIFSGAGIAYFEDTIQAVVALVFFLPLLIDSGGNAGSQSATLMVRALATGDVEMRDWLRLFFREITVALCIGVTMGIAVSVIGVFRGGPDVAVVVSATMVGVVLLGSLIGMSLPFILTRFKLDPATASAPLVTSLADIAGVILYFSIATWYFGIVDGI